MPDEGYRPSKIELTVEFSNMWMLATMKSSSDYVAGAKNQWDRLQEKMGEEEKRHLRHFSLKWSREPGQ